MARQPRITRTITTTIANVTCYNIAEKKVENKTISIPRTYRDEKAMIKKIQIVLNDPNIKPVHVDDFHVEKILYGMTEEKFIAEGEILPSRT